MGITTGLDDIEKRIFLALLGLELRLLDRPAPQPVAIPIALMSVIINNNTQYYTQIQRW
jgi:hypothetical protein